MVASEVIRMGRSRTRQAVIMASATDEPLRLELVREIDDQDAVGIGNADQHEHAHQRHDIQGGVRERQDNQHADEAHGDRQHDQERIDKRAELSDQNQEQQNKRDPKANREALERCVHPFHHSAQANANIRGELRVR